MDRKTFEGLQETVSIAKRAVVAGQEAPLSLVFIQRVEAWMDEYEKEIDD